MFCLALSLHFNSRSDFAPYLFLGKRKSSKHITNGDLSKLLLSFPFLFVMRCAASENKDPLYRTKLTRKINIPFPFAVVDVIQVRTVLLFFCAQTIRICHQPLIRFKDSHLALGREYRLSRHVHKIRMCAPHVSSSLLIVLPQFISCSRLFYSVKRFSYAV